MGNIIDYVKEEMRKADEKPFSEVDSLVLCQFSYLLFDGIVPGFEQECGKTTVKDLYKAEFFPTIFPDNGSRKENQQLLLAMAASPRFRDMALCHYVNETDVAAEKQFAAITITVDEDTKYVAFRGTDSTLVGWKEDFNMAYITPVPAQQTAKEYVEKTAGQWQGKLWLGGHSKGGNLAVYAGIHAEENVRGQIERIYSHDGPGMNEQIIAYSYYQEMAGRIRKTIPGFSVIGTLLGQQEISKVIKSDGVGILQHNPFNWVVEKGEFVPLPGLNKTAELLDQKIDNWVSGMTTEEREEFVNKLFSVISEAENLNGIGENWRDEFGRIAKKLLIP